MTIGQLVFSKKGRDKTKAFVVMDILGEYVFLADGKQRSIDKLKKKKLKHVQPTNMVVNLTTDGRALQDADIRKLINESLYGQLT